MFSFEELREIIKAVKATGRSRTFLEVWNDGVVKDEPFIVTRHDVEFSVERARALAELEYSMDHRATFFFQLTSNAYNIVSHKNIEHVRSIAAMGHDVGLHFHMNGLTDASRITGHIAYETETLSRAIGESVKVFSLHRPVPEILAAGIEVPGLAGAYSPAFFTYTPDVEKDPPKVKYLSDSKHRWSYGYPDRETLAAYDKVQILIHPFSWTEAGGDIYETFRTLFAEKHTELMDTVDAEWVRFQEVRHRFDSEGQDGAG
jgi:hypothetical protein